jgi:hypothetical protein
VQWVQVEERVEAAAKVAVDRGSAARADLLREHLAVIVSVHNADAKSRTNAAYPAHRRSVRSVMSR